MFTWRKTNKNVSEARGVSGCLNKSIKTVPPLSLCHVKRLVWGGPFSLSLSLTVANNLCKQFSSRSGRVLCQKVSMIRKYHKHTLQTNPRHREEDIRGTTKARELISSVVECLTRDQGAAGSSLYGVTALRP